MPDIHAQLAWEARMVDNGIERYRRQQDKAVEGKREHETSAGANLLRAYILQVSEHIRLYLDGKHPGGRRRNNYAKLLATVDTDKVAFMALKTVIASLYQPKTTQTTSASIGRQIEDELQFSKFQTEHKEYFDTLVRDWERRQSDNYDHRRRGVRHLTNRMGMEWEPWTKETHIRIGALVLSLVMEVCDLIEVVHSPAKKGRQGETYIAPTEKCIEWVSKHNAFGEMSHPDRMPCLIPPADWVSPEDGGYFSPQMRKKTPLVKIRSRSSPQHRLLREADLSRVFSAINAMQATGWQVNSNILNTMREVWHKNLGSGMPRSQPYQIPACPLEADVKAGELPEDDPRRVAFMEWKSEARELYTLEKERVAKNLATSRVLRLATDMEQYDAFYYVYTLDFRGRVYAATSGLSPQGTDHGKALLQFSVAKPLGERGLYWLKVHGANKWGEDKSTYDARVQWIEERHDTWLRVADDPIGTRSIWSEADKPYQFLAFCFEYAEAARLGDTFRSRLPIALDGSCNGLQHFSAMLRDEVGGAAVNLTPGDLPADIYQDVGDVATRKLKGLSVLNTPDHGGAVNWLALFESLGSVRMPRKLPKPPVMTLPYGSTQQACTQTTYRWLTETSPNFFEKNTGFRHALYLSPIIWSSISEVVIAARAAMDWLQNCASALAKENRPIQYTTPLGFPVYQGMHKYTSKEIETTIGGRLRIRVASDTDDLDSRLQRQGSSPNFVHSIDATHMMMSINAGVEHGIDSFAMIHDDFGVHACDTEVWHRIIREQFVALHGGYDVLSDFREQHVVAHGIVLPPVPALGNLDINDVLKSPYFFG